MNYKELIDLGFIRHDMDDSVEIDKYGYGGFSLEKELNDRTLLSVYSFSLDKPELYIKKQDSDLYHILPITDEIVRDLCFNTVNDGK